MQDLNGSSLSSSLSSPDSSVARADGTDAAFDQALGLLVRDRAHGGYGGHVSFSEFALLARAVGWSDEAQEDAWYELVAGVPLAETRAVRQLAELLSRACGSPRSAALLPLPSSFSTPAGVAVAPAAPPAPAVTAPPQHQDQPSVARESEAPPRYALPTTTSLYHTASQQSLLQSLLREAPRTTSRPRRRRAPAEAAEPSVFNRLSAPAPSPVTAPKQTARRPSPPRLNKSDADVPSADRPASRASTPRGTYNKPTQSYYARLLGAETATYRDPIAEAPETARVAYHPAPGPSCCVPPGYVEGVARRRQQTAARFYGPHFEETLRRPSFRSDIARERREDDAARLSASPILRLPLSAEAGGRGAVDVRLATGLTTPMAAAEGSTQPGYCAIHLGHQARRHGRSEAARCLSGPPPALRSPLRALPENAEAVVGGRAHNEHFKAHPHNYS